MAKITYSAKVFFTIRWEGSLDDQPDQEEMADVLFESLQKWTDKQKEFSDIQVGDINIH